MFSYALAKPLRLRTGILLGVFVSVMYLILRMSYFTSFGSQKRLMSLVSYGLISLMGVFLVARAATAHGSGRGLTYAAGRRCSRAVARVNAALEQLLADFSLSLSAIDPKGET